MRIGIQHWEWKGQHGAVSLYFKRAFLTGQMLLYADRVQIAQLFHLEGGKKRAQNKVYEEGS